jgi:hypothetical protein
MQLPHEDFPFTLLTPCFSGTVLGKLADHAEMRIPPIRGHVRFWHRALFDPADCNRVWGSTDGDDQGSRISVRFVGSVSTKHASSKPTLLPHKENPNQRGPRPALAAGEAFTLRLQRLPACTADDWDHAQGAVKLWLLLGCLGLRSNRAAGSVWPEGDWVPQTSDALKTTLQNLGLKNWSLALVGLGAGKSADDLREAASDTLEGTGEVFGGIKPQRKPSPTKFKVACLGNLRCLIAVAPNEQVTVNGSRQPILHHAENLLKTKDRWRALGPWHHLLP